VQAGTVMSRLARIGLGESASAFLAVNVVSPSRQLQNAPATSGESARDHLAMIVGWREVSG